MELQHRIDSANILYDEIYSSEDKYETYEEVSHEDLIKIVRMYDITFNMTIDLIKE